MSLTMYVMKTPLPLVLCIMLNPNLSLMLPFLNSTVMNLHGPNNETIEKRKEKIKRIYKNKLKR